MAQATLEFNDELLLDFDGSEITRSRLIFEDGEVSFIDDEGMKPNARDMTYAFRFRTSYTAASQMIFADVDSAAHGFRIYIAESRVQARIQDSNGVATDYRHTQTDASYADGTWHLAVVVWDQTAQTLKIYINGVEDTPIELSSGTVDDCDNGVGFVMGCRPAGTLPLVGELSRFEIWQQAFTAGDVTAYQSTLEGPANPSYQYLFDNADAGGLTLSDTGSGGANGSLGGSTTPRWGRSQIISSLPNVMSKTTVDSSPASPASVAINQINPTPGAKPGGTASFLQVSEDGSSFVNLDGDDMAKQYAANFDGVNDYLTMDGHNDLLASSILGLSFSCEFRAPAADQSGLIYSRIAESGFTDFYWKMGITGDNGGFTTPGRRLVLAYRGQSRYRLFRSYADVADGKWHRMAARCEYSFFSSPAESSKNWVVYLDGERLDGQTWIDTATDFWPYPSGLTVSRADVFLGYNNYYSTGRFKGDVSELGVWTKYELTDDQCQDITLRGHYDATAIAQASAIWKFNNDYTSEVNGHTLSSSGSPVFINDDLDVPQHGEPIGNITATQYNGTNGYSNLAHHDDFDFGTGAFSYSLWLKGPSWGLTDYRALFHHWWNATSTGYWLQLQTGTGYAWAGKGNGGDATGTINLLDDQWHHVAVVWRSNGDVTIYVDGVVDATGNDTSNQDTASGIIRLGQFHGYNRWFKGSIHGAAVWGDERTAEEVLESFVNGYEDPEDPDLVAYWPLANNDGTDLGPNGHHLTMYNSTAVTQLFAPSDGLHVEGINDVSSMGYTNEVHSRIFHESHNSSRSASLENILVNYDPADTGGVPLPLITGGQ